MHRSTSALRGVTGALLLCLLACSPPAPPPGAPGAARCVDEASCERAILSAPDGEIAALLARHAAMTGDDGWSRLFSTLRRNQGGVVVIGEAPGHRSDLDRLPRPPTSVAADALVLRLGRAAKNAHIVLLTPKEARQLFPTDRLAPHMLGLAPSVAVDRANVGRALATAAALRSALSAAAAFDYVAAATHAERLRDLVRSAPAGDEGAMRARFGLWLLDSAGIALAAPNEEGEPGPLPPRLSSPYAELLAVQLSRPNHEAAWKARHERITTGLDPARVAALGRMYASEDTCPGPLAPPIEHPADVAFAGMLALALDTEAAPDEAPAAGKLAMPAWLERYAKLVSLVDESGVAWAALTSLLRQRGELYGLTAEGTGAYARVTDLALKHLGGLEKLAAAHPARFQTLGVVTLIYQPGALSDARLRPALARLVKESVASKIAEAGDAAQLFDAALAAFAAGMSYPAELQQAQFGALRRALEQKLAAPFGQQASWGMAGLHAANAVLGFLLGDETAIAGGASRITRSLSGDLPQRPLARLAASAVRYAELSRSGALDPAVANPAMFSDARAKARAELGSAIGALAEPGPAGAPERDLHQLLAQLADEVVAATIARATTERDGPQCAGESAVSSSPALRDAFDRLRKKRKALIESRAFDEGDSAWARRARLVGLILSDVIDVLDQRAGKLAFAVPTPRAATLLDEGVTGWIDHAAAELAAGLYLLARSSLDGGHPEVSTDRAARALRALGTLFGGEGDSSLFATLAKLGSEVGDAADAGAVLTGYARRAYAAQAPDHGDLLLMMRLAADVVRDQPVDQAAIDLAKAQGRKVYLPLLVYGEKTPARQAKLVAAMRAAATGVCDAPSPEALITAQEAIADFKAGSRDEALAALGAMLDTAEKDGLVVPRQIFRFDQHEGKKVFNAEQSVSFGTALLAGASAFQIGLGFQSEDSREGAMSTRFADPASRASTEEAARYFAHAALLHATFAFVHDQDAVAIRAAQRAIGTWIAGMRLGKARVFVGNKTAEWARDATATLLVAGQLAADRGQIFLAGDLLTLAKASLDPASGDDAVTALLDPLPEPLTGIPELESTIARAKDTATMLAGSLPCTQKNGDVAALVRVACDAYPLALALRATDSLTVLPRLKKAQGSPICEAYGALDRFLAAADQGRYEPARLLAAVTQLEKQERLHDAASVLARHRHPDHCNPQLIELARRLAPRDELGIHLRADLWSVATNCGQPEAIEADLLALDELTQKHALPTRNFEVLLFATRLALKHNHFGPLAAIAKRARFIQRHHALGPDFGTAALLVDHAAAVGVGDAVDIQRTLPFYRLLCTTFPPKERSAMCHAISLLRGSGSSADKKRAAAKALADFLHRAASSLEPRADAAPKP